MLIIDGHLDLAWNALYYDRDLRASVFTIRTQEAGMVGKGRAVGTVALPEMSRGRVALCFATLLARNTGHPVPQLDFPSVEQAYASARGQLAYYRGLEQTGEIRVITDSNTLDSHVTEWETWERNDTLPDSYPPLGVVISMEGADPVFGPESLQEWWDAGLRLIGITHYGLGRYAGGTATEEGLSELGPALLTEMERLGYGLDLTHCSDAAFWEALELFNGPVLASHNNCRALVPHQRQFSDEQLKAIIERDGVLGAAFDVWMLEPGFIKGQTTNAGIALSRVVDHIDHVCQLAGNSHHAAIGSDLDGLFGLEQSPCDFDTIADLQRLPAMLAERGYTDADIANIMHGNWLRFLHSTCRGT
ncbi:MAG: membrane dipeptidase [Candidatus Hydrogenedentes bacterium]|nr:membrane dipeptidase [Candidatus Hydrogenedentota bacterium]